MDTIVDVVQQQHVYISLLQLLWVLFPRHSEDRQKCHFGKFAQSCVCILCVSKNHIPSRKKDQHTYLVLIS